MASARWYSVNVKFRMRQALMVVYLSAAGGFLIMSMQHFASSALRELTMYQNFVSSLVMFLMPNWHSACANHNVGLFDQKEGSLTVAACTLSVSAILNHVGVTNL